MDWLIRKISPNSTRKKKTIVFPEYENRKLDLDYKENFAVQCSNLYLLRKQALNEIFELAGQIFTSELKLGVASIYQKYLERNVLEFKSEDFDSFREINYLTEYGDILQILTQMRARLNGMLDRQKEEIRISKQRRFFHGSSFSDSDDALVS